MRMGWVHSAPMSLSYKMGMGQNPVPLVNIPNMNIIVFIGMFTYPILMVIGINPWLDGQSLQDGVSYKPLAILW